MKMNSPQKYKPHDQKHTSTEQEQQSPNDAVMTSLWTRFLALYGRQWEKENGTVDGDQYRVWSEALKKFNTNQIKRGLQAVIDEGSEYVPNLIKFLRLCRTVEPYSDHVPTNALPKPKPRYSVRRIESLKIQFLFDMPIDIPKLKSDHMIMDWNRDDEAVLMEAMAQFTPHNTLEEVNAVIDHIEFSHGKQINNAYGVM
jgi:hypothetical protein